MIKQYWSQGEQSKIAYILKIMVCQLFKAMQHIRSAIGCVIVNYKQKTTV